MNTPLRADSCELRAAPKSCRLVEWERMELMIRGDRLSELVSSVIEAGAPDVEKVRISFEEGVIVIRGSVRKVIAIPFQLEIRRVSARGQEIVVAIDQVATFGFLPLPSFLFRLAEGKIRDERIVFNGERRELTIRMDRFLPAFIDAAIDGARLVAGGIVITLGPGGADLPPDWRRDGL